MSQSDDEFTSTPIKSMVPEAPKSDLNFSDGFFDTPDETDLDITPTHNNPETPLVQEKQIVHSSPVGPELGDRQSRYVYLLTYNQADMERFSSVQTFAPVIVDAFKKCNVSFERWVCSKEKHPNTGGFHYHMAIQLPRQSRWKAIKNQIHKDNNITVYFTIEHYFIYHLKQSAKNFDFLQQIALCA